MARRHKKSTGTSCDPELARAQMLQDVDEWFQSDSFAVKTPKVVWRSLLRDAGLKPRDLKRAKYREEATSATKYTREEIARKLEEQIRNASNAQACSYERQRGSAISRDIWGLNEVPRSAEKMIRAGLRAGKRQRTVTIQAIVTRIVTSSPSRRNLPYEHKGWGGTYAARACVRAKPGPRTMGGVKRCVTSGGSTPTSAIRAAVKLLADKKLR